MADSDAMTDRPAGALDATTYEARLEAVLESITDGFYALDTDWRFVIFNRAAELYFNARRAQVLGRALLDVFPEGRSTNFMRLCEAAMNAGESATFQAPSRLRPDRIVELRISPMRGGGIAVVLTDVTDREAAEDRRRLMVNELNHRVKNTLATVQAIATQSLRGPEVSDEARDRFKARLMALARANDVLVDDTWRGATLGDVAAQVAAPYGGVDPKRFALQGPEVRLRPELAVAVTLALHELATNAAKYGALSIATGRIDLAWAVDGEAFGLVWREIGGPPVTPPERVGFGDRLIREGLGRALRGSVDLSYLREGLVCTVKAPCGGLGPQA